MKKIWKVIFTVMTLALCLCAFTAEKSKDVSAASKKASLVKTKITTSVGSSSAQVCVKNYDTKAKYTYSVDKKSLVEISSMDPYYAYDKAVYKSIGFYVKPLKTGTAKVTIKETKSGKTKKVGTCTIVIKKGSSYIDNEFTSCSVAVGSAFSLSAAGILQVEGADAVYSSSNTTVASVSQKGVVSAKAVGTAKITARLGSDTTTITIKVVDKKINSQYAAYANSIKTIATAKLTTSNITSMYNKYMSLLKADVDSKVLDKNDFIQMPLLYSMADAKERLVTFLSKKAKVSILGASLDVVRISSVKSSSKKITVKLGGKVTKYDVMAQNLVYDTDTAKKYTSSTKATTSFLIKDKSGYCYLYQGNIKAGQKTVTGVFESGTNRKTVSKGKTYHYAIANTKKPVFKMYTVTSK